MTSVTHDVPDAADETTLRPTIARDPSAVDEIPNMVDAVIGAVEEQLRTQRLPTATYRVQFNNRCAFKELEAMVPYLYTLGVSDLYSSPFLQARPGSSHGYDIVNHAAINSEIGTLDELRSLRSALREHDMGLLADVVPNHMSATPHLNVWWQDVLENGPSSQFASHFDIDWMPLKPDLADKVLLPVLGDQLGKVLEDGQLSVHYGEGAFWLQYYDRSFPLAPRSYTVILAQRLDELQQQLGTEHAGLSELLSILTAIKNLPERSETDAERLVERRREKEVVKRRLHELVQQSPEIAEFVKGNVVAINGTRGDARSFDALDELLKEQAYRLAFWRVAADEINYRRFFDINDLAAICTEHQQVFADSHRLLFELLDEGTITGLRIDHPDGLYDPLSYFFQLQEHQFLRLCREAFERLSTSPEEASEEGSTWLSTQHHLRDLWLSASKITGSPLARPLYVVVEKILAREEPLPEDWPVHGTVGYEFLNAVNGLFVDPRGERPLSALFTRFTGQSLDFDALAYNCKRLIVRMSMVSELNVLGHRLDRISERNRWTRDFTLSSQTRALQEVIACFSVYRTYIQPERVLERDRLLVEGAVGRAKRHNPAMEASIFDFVGEMLLLRFHTHDDEDERRAVESFVGKFQQLTGPIMAKAVEDTAFYRFSRLVSLNEVGGEPARFGTTLDEFQRANQSRLPRQSHGLNASSTHDTKRSEDVRARINVLSEIPKQWRERVQRWSRWNKRHKTVIDGSEAPSRNAEYVLYQTIVGTWPDSLPNGDARAAYVARLQQHMLKVIREAKLHTSWVSPNEPYEAAMARFVAGMFEEDRRRPFLTDVHEFASQVAEHGRWNSLSQLVLKIASPGVPDFYQGTELWSLTLVDPDNRHPVDFPQHREVLDDLLKEMAAALALGNRDQVVETWLNIAAIEAETNAVGVSEFLQHLIENRRDGRIKILTTLLSLRARRRFPDLFTSGEYNPLAVTGQHADRVIAFARRKGNQQVVVIVPRLTVAVTGFGGSAPLGDHWLDTAVVFPESQSPDTLYDLISRRAVHPALDPLLARLAVPVADALRHFTVAVLISSPVEQIG